MIDAIGKVLIAHLRSSLRKKRNKICECVISHIDALESTQVPISVMHNIVENALEQVRPIVAKSYRDYRNYKQDFVRMLDDVYKKARRSCMWAIRKIPMQIPHWSPQSAA